MLRSIITPILNGVASYLIGVAPSSNGPPSTTYGILTDLSKDLLGPILGKIVLELGFPIDDNISISK